MEWTKGFTHAELDAAEERYGICFPPDLAASLCERRPAVGGYDWSIEDKSIRRMLAWPAEMLIWDVENNGFWRSDWPPRPRTPDERAAIFNVEFAKVPRLIPVYSHRFIPETPHQTGNPIFSMHGEDTIYYGANLTEYYNNEFGGGGYRLGEVRRIPFWSDLAELRWSE